MQSPTTTWSTLDGTCRLGLEPKVWERITRLSLISNSKETGGVLVGYYSNDCTTAIITDATPPPRDSARTHSSFLRGVVGLRALFEKLWNKVERRHYVGEWHYHPTTAVEPSKDDTDQMVRIASTPDYRCREPILIVIGQPRGPRVKPPFRAFVCTAEPSVREFLPMKRVGSAGSGGGAAGQDKGENSGHGGSASSGARI
jgi:integrative and conjugative element protein (TIGR02256 family)